ncbi:ROK family protein [Dinghuibacter silviterrae]|uniref:Putative NBD/HSP70 family sugar kinase n=1 Tax=Dinghuibacter silviterrae TaxID=1539049 RepID=A0A4R8DNS8_9BACT|nr:ROK family protein [Dinghuibacter silviterrae]TDW99683.1 putative NBD/HSP70 family sugar kinase [Dinghuibacter silviterrae]
MEQWLWGIDLGGTKVEGVIMPAAPGGSASGTRGAAAAGDPQPLVRMRLDTETRLGYTHVIDQIARLVDKMKAASGLTPTSVGFGTPGVLDPILGTMKNANSVVLNGQPLQRDLTQALGVPAILANDANCFALAETRWGAVRARFPEARVVFGVIAGTGVGGGLVVDGRVWAGKHGIAGEWGHNYLDASGGPCYCGKTGCVETVISGPALERFYKGISGSEKRLKDIAVSTEPAAVATMERLYHFFGKGLSVVTDIVDPDVIVVGGGVGNIQGLYTEGVRSLSEHIFNNRLDVPVIPPLLGDSAGVFGAAALTLQP